MRKSISVRGVVRLLIGANKLYGTDNMDKGEIQKCKVVMIVQETAVSMVRV